MLRVRTRPQAACEADSHTPPNGFPGRTRRHGARQDSPRLATSEPNRIVGEGARGEELDQPFPGRTTWFVISPCGGNGVVPWPPPAAVARRRPAVPRR